MVNLKLKFTQNHHSIFELYEAKEIDNVYKFSAISGDVKSDRINFTLPKIYRL